MGVTTPVLDLFIYRGRWQLGASTALYSDGHRYRPLLAAFKYIKKDLLQARNMLVLGAGLGSATYILQRMDIQVDTTFVDIDSTVINWGKELLPRQLADQNHWICADAQEYVSERSTFYDIIVIDIFLDRIVPQFVSSNHFLTNCIRLLNNPNSKIVLNYIINNKDNWQEVQSNLALLFHIEHIIDLGLNQVIIAKAK